MSNRKAKFQVECSNGEAVQMKNAVMSIQQDPGCIKSALAKSIDSLSLQEKTILLICSNHPDLSSGKVDQPEDITFPVDLYSQENGLNIFYDADSQEEAAIAESLYQSMSAATIAPELLKTDSYKLH